MKSLPAVVSLLLLTSLSTGFAQSPDDTFTQNELDEEQRLVEVHLNEARKEIDRSVERIKAGLPNTALLTIFRADEDLSRAEEMLSFHPQHIEKLLRSLFYNEERVRAEFREKYELLDGSFDEIEKEFWVLVDEYDEVTGRTGARSLRSMLKHLEGLRSIRDDETVSAEEREAAAEALRNHSVLVEQGDAEGALEAVEGLTSNSVADMDPRQGPGAAGSDFLAGADLFEGSALRMSQPAAPWNDLAAVEEDVWYQGRMPGGEEVRTRRTRECDVPGAPPGCRDTYEVAYDDGSVATFFDYDPVENPDGTVTVRNDSRTTYPDGSYDFVSEERIFDPETCELKIVRTTTRFDANGEMVGDKVVETSYYQDCGLDPREVRRAQINASMQIEGKGGVELISPSGELRRVYTWEDGPPKTERRGEYVGGEGKNLISETEYELTYERDEYGAILGVSEQIGRQRNWEFVIEQVPDSVAYDDDYTEMTAQFRFADRKGKTAFEVDSWEVRGPDGAVVAAGSGAGPMGVTVSSSGQFTFIVSGRTDWGSPFSITQLVTMNL